MQRSYGSLEDGSNGSDRRRVSVLRAAAAITIAMLLAVVALSAMVGSGRAGASELVEEVDGLELNAFLSQKQAAEFKSVRAEQESLSSQLAALVKRADKIQPEDTKVIVQVAPPGPPGPLGIQGVVGDKVQIDLLLCIVCEVIRMYLSSWGILLALHRNSACPLLCFFSSRKFSDNFVCNSLLHCHRCSHGAKEQLTD